jgi:hypothetical protein
VTVRTNCDSIERSLSAIIDALERRGLVAAASRANKRTRTHAA